MLSAQNVYKKSKISVRSEDLETLSTNDLNGYRTGKGRGDSSLFLCPFRTIRKPLRAHLPFLKGCPLPDPALLISLLIESVKLASVEYNGRYFYKPAKFQEFCEIGTNPARTGCRATSSIPGAFAPRLIQTT